MANLRDEKKHEVEQCAHDKITVETMKALLRKEHRKNRLEHTKTNHCCNLPKPTRAQSHTNGNEGVCSIPKHAI